MTYPNLSMKWPWHACVLSKVGGHVPCPSVCCTTGFENLVSVFSIILWLHFIHLITLNIEHFHNFETVGFLLQGWIFVFLSFKDYDLIDPFLVQLVIIGTKYDIFQVELWFLWLRLIPIVVFIGKNMPVAFWTLLGFKRLGKVFWWGQVNPDYFI